MAYFPESILPLTLKDVNQDVKGNEYIISGFDINTHTEEIRATEKFIGHAPAVFPAPGYGIIAGSGYSGYSGLSGYSGFVPVRCFPTKTILGTLEAIKTRLNSLKTFVKVTSGTVSGDRLGTIPFPTDWTTTLVSEIMDCSTLETDTPAIIDEVELASTSGMPLKGFISIISDQAPLQYAAVTPIGRYVLIPTEPSAIGGCSGFSAYSGFSAVSGMSGYSGVYNLDGQPVSAVVSGAVSYKLPLEAVKRMSGLCSGIHSNIEYLYYDGIDGNKIKNVRRKQLGTNSFAHGPDDLVFKGRVSVQISPVLYALANTAKKIGQIEYVLRSNGTLNAKVLYTSNESTWLTTTDSTLRAYAHYQAVLVGDLDPIHELNFVEECE